MTELSKPEEDLQDPGEAQGPEEAQLLGAEAGEAASTLASSPQVSCSALAEALLQEALNEMVANLIKFLLFKYRAKELSSQAKMLKKVLRDNQEHFSVDFSQASECPAAGLWCGGEGGGPQGAHLHHGPHPGPHLRCDAEQWAEHAQGRPPGAGAPGTRRQRQRSEACVQRSENREGPGSTRSQGEEGAL
ncbi:unnamed protein product, partial [Rangifer tarandus platyrhynchus]